MGKPLTYIFTLVCAVALPGCQEDVPDADLVGTLWTLEAIEVPGEPDILPNAKWTYPIQFFEDYHFEGGIACNHLVGEYMLTGGGLIQFKNFSATKIYCGESSNSLAEQYGAGLSAVHSYEIIGKKLQLHFNDSVLKFRNLE